MLSAATITLDTSVIQQSAHVLARFPTRGGSLRPRFTYRMEDSKL
jgi:hypothetical protein